jgi:hypothetical protein
MMATHTHTHRVPRVRDYGMEIDQYQLKRVGTRAHPLLAKELLKAAERADTKGTPYLPPVCSAVNGNGLLLMLCS